MRVSITAMQDIAFADCSIPADLGIKAANLAHALNGIPERELKLTQWIPHFDTNRPFHLAILLNDRDPA
jgi:hypothetical protein